MTGSEHLRQAQAYVESAERSCRQAEEKRDYLTGIEAKAVVADTEQKLRFAELHTLLAIASGFLGGAE